MKIRLLSASVLAVCLGLAVAPAAKAAPTAIVQQEINYLLLYIKDSGCDFYRNGTWSDAKAAEKHVHDKYDFLLDMRRIDTTRDFIDKAATESSLSGQPYAVRCGSDMAMPSSRWLNNALARYRARISP